MATVSDLDAKRWRDKESPGDHKPQSALDAVARDMAAGKVTPRHIVIVVEYADEADGGSRTAYYQAGPESTCGQIGLMTRAAQLMGEV